MTRRNVAGIEVASLRELVFFSLKSASSSFCSSAVAAVRLGGFEGVHGRPVVRPEHGKKRRRERLGKLNV